MIPDISISINSTANNDMSCGVWNVCRIKIYFNSNTKRWRIIKGVKIFQDSSIV